MATHDKHDEDDDLAPTTTPGYVPGQLKSTEEYAKLDAEDEALNRWKASLGIVPGVASVDPSRPKITLIALELVSSDLPAGKKITLDLSDPLKLAALKENRVKIKEGSEYHVRIVFKVNHSICSGLRYLQAVKRGGIRFVKWDKMIGSYGPNPPEQPVYIKDLEAEEAPSGIIARGEYNVLSRVIDDDGEEYAKFEWGFQLAKDW